MICPKCRREYFSGEVNCPDCQVPLKTQVQDNRHPEEPIYVELQTVLIPNDFSQLTIAKSLLESAGIRYFAKGESLAKIYSGGFLGFGLQTVELQVAVADVPYALELLEKLNSLNDETDETD